MGIYPLMATLVAAAAIPNGDDASRPTVLCPALKDAVDVAFGAWGGEGTQIRREQFALAGNEGANRPGGYMIYGSATPTRATTDQACRRAVARPNPDRRRLSGPFSYRKAGQNVYFAARDGTRLIPEWLILGTIDFTDRMRFGVRFRCPVRSAITILITDSRDRAGRVVGTYFSVRVGRELLATAVLRQQGESFFRISSRCDQR
jgi:hypothetical protein